MKMREFTLERMFARLRPRASHLLSPASCESCSMSEILNMADEECLKLWNHLDLGYTNYRGLAKLRDVIATRYNTLGPDDILEVVPEEGIFIFMNTLLEEGDEVIAIQPTLPSLHEIPKALGCKVTPWPLEVTDWGWKLNMNFLSENISNKTKLIILNIPNNPTGYMPVKTDLFRIIEMADRVGAWIFCEETFRFMEHDPASVVPSIADIYPKGVVLGGINKFGLAGLRMGWLATQNRKIMAECSTYKDYTTLCPSAPSEILALIALRNVKYLQSRNHSIILENLALASEFFNSKPNWFQWIEPNGGSTAFPKLLAPFKVSEMCDKAMEQVNLMIVSDRVFGYNNNHFRLGLGRKDFAQSMALFVDFMEKFVTEKQS